MEDTQKLVPRTHHGEHGAVDALKLGVRDDVARRRRPHRRRKEGVPGRANAHGGRPMGLQPPNNGGKQRRPKPPLAERSGQNAAAVVGTASCTDRPGCTHKTWCSSCAQWLISPRTCGGNRGRCNVCHLRFNVAALVPASKQASKQALSHVRASIQNVAPWAASAAWARIIAFCHRNARTCPMAQWWFTPMCARKHSARDDNQYAL